MRRSFALLIVAAVIMGFMNAAGALVPVGATWEDHARAQVSEAATVVASPGRELVIASYTLAPGTDSGWRNNDGPTVLAVTSGTLALHSAAGCATKEYTAGQAVVVSAGRHRLSNAGDEPLAFTGAVLDGAADEITPFLDAGEAPPPASCEGTTGDRLRTSPSPASVVRSSRGTFVGPDAYGHSDHAHHAGGIAVEAGKDVYVVSVRAEPGGTSGWMTHRATLGIVTKGTLTYYEGRDGRCVKSQFRAGQAYVHGSPVTHIASNEGPEPLEAIYMFFNMPHNAHPVPVAGNFTEAIDITPLPPVDCPRLS
jgi:mannose-6-phosphate isomerase-like protein (cupin superfamily)